MATLLFVASLFVIATAETEEATPASLLAPRNFNHHPFEAIQFLKEVEPTKQGPVLFPNDAPPPPKPPLIVTSRPLLESIARSELNPINNSIASPSQNHASFKPYPQFRLKPEFRIKNFVNRYKPGFLKDGYVPADYGPSVVEQRVQEDNRYSDYEQRTVLPPIYKAIADHAHLKALKHQRPDNYKYQTNHDNNDIHPDNNEYNEGSNYAFSYTVKDHKTGDDFSHSQQSSGSATNGEYRVRLPDGRMQIVSYTADENGYKADVRYDEDKTAGNSIDNHNEYNHNDGGNVDYKYNEARIDDYQYNQNDLTHRNHVIQNSKPVQNRYSNDYNYDYNYNKDLYDHTPKIYTTRVPNHYNNDYNDNSHNYVQNINTKPDYKPVKEDFNQYSDISKEYYNNDYSAEYEGKNDNYAPHTSKFSVYDEKSSLGTIVVPSTLKPRVFNSVKPSYDELKHLFVHKNLQVTPTPTNPLVEINVPSTTPGLGHFEDTTEHVVVIGKPKLYTNIRNEIPITPTHDYVTPRNYLVSTIASLKDRINAKPVLSNNFINRINKYLSFK